MPISRRLRQRLPATVSRPAAVLALCWALCWCPGAATAAQSQEPPAAAERSRTAEEEFRDGTGWQIGGKTPQDYTVRLDPEGGRAGSACALLENRIEAPREFVTLMRYLPMAEYRGKRLRMSAYLKISAVEGWVGLWMRADRNSTTLAFDNMQDRPLTGDHDWTRREVVIEIPAETNRLMMGVILEGAGRLWVDDFDLEIVGPEVPLTDMMQPERPAQRQGGPR